jgi:hypothetical protein
MERTRRLLEKLATRVSSGRLKSRDKIIQAAKRILGRNHGARYYSYTVSAQGAFAFSECESFPGPIPFTVGGYRAVSVGASTSLTYHKAWAGLRAGPGGRMRLLPPVNQAERIAKLLDALIM